MGKSALLAQVAHHYGAGKRGEGTGCLLHMIKSHTNPRRFLQFLLWQAARALGKSLGDTVYQGDVDDLRNALLGALEMVRHTQEHALMVIDALDELDPTGERINFLPAHLPAGIRVLLSCRPDIPLVHAVQRRLSSLTVEELPPLSPEDLSMERCKWAGSCHVPSSRVGVRVCSEP